MRCLALAQNWKRSGGSVTFLLPEGSPGIEQRIRSENFLLEALEPGQFADAVVHRVLHSKQRAVVLDGYGFGSREQMALSKAGIAVLTVDDYGHATDYPVRWILNQNAGAHQEMYVRRTDNARLLLGPGYALLRDEFSPWLGWKRRIPERASKVLVTIGGSDPYNLSVRILESIALLGQADLQLVLVVGSSNPHFQCLQSATGRLPVRVRIVQDALDMPELMAWADVAISGAGGTSYELCYMGLPSLLFVIAENQRGVAEHLSELSAAVHAGTAHDFNSQRFAEELCCLIGDMERRRAMSHRARALVDGLGGDRVRAALLDKGMQLRQLRETDCQLLFSWANDPGVRSASFHSAPVQWEEHRQWFEQKLFAQKLPDPLSVIYIAETRTGEPVGQVRFHLDRDGERQRATLSIVVAPQFRGAGWGKELIAFSIRRLAREHSIHRVDAFVKPENQPSIRLFESAAFRQAGSKQVAGQPALLFTWECGSGTHAN
ncbi:MAG: UDP-2,4-diacetamido-2,4,6-trideoxy-beta-L-altropyranose hydrolase [Terriglobales bacterium]